MKKIYQILKTKLIALTHVPMKNWSRVIIETDEEHSKVLAIVTNNNFELADGLRVRLSPAPNDQPFGGKLS